MTLLLDPPSLTPAAYAAAQARHLRDLEALLDRAANDPPWQPRKRPRLPQRRHRHAVVCVETGVVYPSIRAAALAVGRFPSAVSMAVNGHQVKSGGFHWRRA